MRRVMIRLVVVAACWGVVAFSAHGQTFTMTNKGRPLGGFAQDIEVHTSGALYAVVSSGLFKSTDNGDNWTRISVSTETTIQDIDIDANGNIYVATFQNVYLSTDNGVTWTRRNTLTGLGTNSTLSMIKRTGTSASSPIYVVGNYNSTLGRYQVLRSIDNATTFTEVYSEASIANRITQITNNALGNIYLYVVGKGIVKSDASGSAGYAPSNTGIVAPTATINLATPRATLAFAGSELFALFSSNVYKSIDNGANWTDITPATFTQFSQALIAGSGSTIHIFNAPLGNLHSYAATVWSTNTFTPRIFTANRFQVKSSTEFFLSEAVGVSKSSDGTSWTAANTGLNGVSYSSTPMQPMFSFNGALYIPNYSTYRSTDGGVVWTSLGTMTSQPTSITVLSDGTFAATNFSLYVSIDAGGTWTFKPTSAPYTGSPIGVAAYGADLYSLSSTGRIFKSTDAGTNWTEVVLTGMPGVYTTSSLNNFFISNDVIYFTIMEASVVKHFRVTLAGVATQIPSPPLAVTLQSNGFREYLGKYFVFSRNGSAVLLSTSTDGGANWATVTCPGSTTFPAYYLTHNGYPAIVTNTGIVNFSRDDGATWNTINLGFGSTEFFTPRSAIVDDLGYLNVLYDGKGLYVTDTQVALPSAPTGLQVIGNSFAEVRLEWNDNSTNESYFRIDQSIADNTHYDSISRVIQSGSFPKAVATITVDPSKTYYYKVVAVNGAGKSAYSNEVTIVIPAKCPTTIPDNRSWSLATLNLSGQGARTTTNVNLKLGRLDDYIWFSAVSGNSPSWTSPYASINGGTGGLIETCNSVYLSTAANSSLIPDGNGTWDPVAKKITIKWKINQSVLANPPSIPFSETTELTMNVSDPAPSGSGLPTLFVFALNNTSVAMNWSATIPFAQEIALERATAVGGPYTEVARINHPETMVIDNFGGLVFGTTYFYRLQLINATGTATTASTSFVFQKPVFVATELEDQMPVTVRVSQTGVDVNNDGWDDHYYSTSALGSATQKSALFINNKDGTFQKQILDPSSMIRHINAKFADFNNDGNVDMLCLEITTAGVRRVVRTGDGTGNFVTTSQLGAATLPHAPIDFDLDGKLDFIGRIPVLDATGASTMSTLSFFKNMGSNNFQKSLDLFANETTTATTLTDLQIFDYDVDNDLDIVLFGSFETGTNTVRVYSNNGDGTYTKLTAPEIDLHPVGFIQMVSVADIDNDGDMDVFFGSGSGPRFLMRNDGGGDFTSLTIATLLDPVASQVSSSIVDLDNDQDLDVLTMQPVGNLANIQVGIYMNNNGTYTRREGEAISNWAYGKNALAHADYNHDGYLDFSVSSTDRKGRLFINNKLTTGNWVQIKLRGVVSNRSGVGSFITVTTGALLQSRLVSTQSTTSNGGHSSLVQHFGLGASTSMTIKVKWPSGKNQTFNNVTTINQFIELVEDTDGPVISNLAPANAATGVAAATKLSFSVGESGTPVTGKFLKVFKTSDLLTAVHSIDITAGTLAAGTCTFTLPAKLLQSTSYQATLDAGAFIDGFANPSLAVPGTAWAFTTAAGPVAVTLGPLDGAINVPTGSALEITFDKDVVAVAGKKLSVKDEATTIIDVDVSIAGSITGSKYSFTPATALPGSRLLEVLVQPGAFIDNATSQNEFGGLASTWKFTTADDVKPTITFEESQVATLNKGFAQFPANIIAADNVAVAGVKFFHRKASEKDFTSTSATGSGTAWTVSIQPAFGDDMGFDYYIQAVDAIGNKGRLPIDTTKSLTSRIKFTGTNQPAIIIPEGGGDGDWKIIAIPYEESTAIGPMFGALGEATRKTWRMLRYQEAPQAWLEYPAAFTTILRGQGYFVNSKSAANIAITEPSSPNNSRGNLYSMDLVKGWNLIGNPYTVSVNLNDIRNYNNATAAVGELKLFNGTAYGTDNPVLLPHTGGFVMAQNNITAFKFSFPGQTAAGRVKENNTDLPGDWLSAFTLEQGLIKTVAGGVGMRHNASFGYDEHDDFSPPRFINFLEINFPHPEHFYGKFARDVVPMQNEHDWQFDMSSNIGGSATLRWESKGLEDVPGDLLLYDIEFQRIVNMREQASYSFEGTFRKFKVFFGTEARSRIKPDRAMLGEAYPNPSPGKVTIPFSLPESTATAHVRLEVYDLLGKRVATIIDGLLLPGFHEREWTPADVLSGGIYTYRLVVTGDPEGPQSRRLLLRY